MVIASLSAAISGRPIPWVIILFIYLIERGVSDHLWLHPNCVNVIWR